MKRILFTSTFLLLVGICFSQKSNSTKSKGKQYDLDVKAIKSMAGCYKVSFEFAETFSPDTAYEYHERKFEWGIEYVLLVEDTENLIALQHLLIVNDSIIIKHWRQDWVYENTEILSFHKDNEWKTIKLTKEQAKGTWTQKVFQVDDSPRYEGYGTWNHVDGRHFWESVADAPLPRRELMKRSDYNVLRRHSKIEISNSEWFLEQDNEKIVRSESADKLICWEKGMEKFSVGNYNCQGAIDWWAKQNSYWADVRKVWREVFAESKSLKLAKKVEDKSLYEQLFDLGDNYEKTKEYNSNEAQAAIKKIITLYISKS